MENKEQYDRIEKMTKYVMKFGGTSLKDAQAVERAVKLISEKYNPEEQLIVVVSAAGKLNDSDLGDKVTNLLEQVHKNENITINLQEIIRRTSSMCKELSIPEPEKIYRELKTVNSNSSNKDYSRIVSFGERLSSWVVNSKLQRKLSSQLLDYNQFGMLTEDYKEALAVPLATEKIEQALSNKKGVIVIPGFLGYNKDGEVTTLGRDGSNYTATKVGEAISADAVYIFSDEPGVRRANPKLVPDAEILKEITYNEAIEFAELGAKIINAKSVWPARKQNIPIYIIDENYNGTKISNSISIEHMGAKIIASSPEHHLINIRYDTDKPGVLADISGKFKEARINIESIADERHALGIAFVDSEGGIGKLLSSLGKDYSFDLESGFSRISVIGEGMRNQVGLLSKITSSFSDKDISIEMISQTLSQLNVTVFVKQDYERTAVKTLYDKLFVNNK